MEFWASILFLAYLSSVFFSSVSFILNLIILIALFWRIRRNLSDKENHKYYLLALLLTALFFVHSGSGIPKYVLELGEKILISKITITVVLVYLFAHVVFNAYKGYIYFKKKYKRGVKSFRKKDWKTIKYIPVYILYILEKQNYINKRLH